MSDAKRQSGNALFLILIAVALFAALSYAITQSGRGGGTINREQAAIAASQITQYAASVRTIIQRMILSGTQQASICYDMPGANTSCSAPAQYRVFDADGGGGTWQCPTDTQVDFSLGFSGWVFRGTPNLGNQGVYIKDLGTNTDVTGRDAVANLWGVHLAVCQQINKGLGLDQTPADNKNYSGAFDTTYNLATNVMYATPGEPFACVADDNGYYSSEATTAYMYYHALIEQ